MISFKQLSLLLFVITKVFFVIIFFFIFLYLILKLLFNFRFLFVELCLKLANDIVTFSFQLCIINIKLTFNCFFINIRHVKDKMILVMIKLFRITLGFLYFFKLASCKLCCTGILKFINSFSNCLFASMNSFYYLSWSSSKSMNFCSYQNGGTTKTIWSSSNSHPRSTH